MDKDLFVRQTDLTMSELVEITNNLDSCGDCFNQEVPRCMAVNEIGVEFAHGNQDAEEHLIRFLGDNEENVRLISYSYLKAVDQNSISLAIEEAVAKFEVNPDNAEGITQALEQIKEWEEFSQY